VAHWQERGSEARRGENGIVALDGFGSRHSLALRL